MPAATRSCERQRMDEFSTRASRGGTALSAPWFQTLGFQRSERVGSAVLSQKIEIIYYNKHRKLTQQHCPSHLSSKGDPGVILPFSLSLSPNASPSPLMHLIPSPNYFPDPRALNWSSLGLTKMPPREKFSTVKPDQMAPLNKNLLPSETPNSLIRHQIPAIFSFWLYLQLHFYSYSISSNLCSRHATVFAVP